MRRKLKRETRLAYQRRDIRNLRLMLGYAAKQLRRVAEGDKAGFQIFDAANNAAAECESYLARHP